MSEKTASVMVYLQEELGDARLRAEQLNKQVAAVLELIENSEHRDHFFEVAGHLIHGVPDTVFKLTKALDAAALAAGKLDEEEIKQGLRPEKVEELEAAAQETRLRYLNRRSEEHNMMTPKNAADALLQLATETDEKGSVPVAKLARLIAALEPNGKTASSQPKRAAVVFREAAKYLQAADGNASPTKLARNLRKILADSDMAPLAGAGEEFQKENPKITDEEAKRIDEEHEKNKNVVKDKEGRFETGKPADPTQNMTPEQSATWKEMNDKYRDIIKDLHK